MHIYGNLMFSSSSMRPCVHVNCSDNKEMLLLTDC